MHKLRRSAICLIGLLLLWQIPSGTANGAEPPLLSPAQMREDFTVLREKLATLDRSFDDVERHQFEMVVHDAALSADNLDAGHFALAVSRAVAIARNGHTSSSLGPYVHNLPVRLWWFRDGLYVIKTHPDFAELLGARIEAFGPFTPEQALTRAASYISGTDPNIKVTSPSYLIGLELLQEIGATRSAQEVRLSVTLQEGKRRTLRLGPEPAEDPEPRRASYAALIPSDATLAGRWPHVLDAIVTRPSIYRPGVDLETEWLQAEPGVLYLRSNRIFGSQQNCHPRGGSTCSWDR